MIKIIPTGPQDYAALRGAGVWRGYAVPEGGLEPDEVLQMLVGWSQRLNDAQGWGTWIAVSGGEAVVSLAVKSPPVEGSVEIGYGTAPARRGQGHATAAVLAVLHDLMERGVTRATAETSVGNPASGRVLEKAGFQQIGTRMDAEDGALVLWSRAIP